MNKTDWLRAGPRTSRTQPALSSQAKREEKELAKAEADVHEAERRVARQTVLIGELKASGDIASEPAKALVRLETELLVRRDRHQELAAKHASPTALDIRRPLDIYVHPKPSRIARKVPSDEAWTNSIKS